MGRQRSAAQPGSCVAGGLTELTSLADGYPLRMVIPGQIGGRSVKWLRSIEVSERESQHYLHFNDNKLLPTEYTPDRARADKDVWRNPAYIIVRRAELGAI